MLFDNINKGIEENKNKIKSKQAEEIKEQMLQLPQKLEELLSHKENIAKFQHQLRKKQNFN